MSKGALEPPGGQLDFPSKKLHLWELAAAGDMRANSTEHYVLDVADFVE